MKKKMIAMVLSLACFLLSGNALADDDSIKSGDILMPMPNGTLATSGGDTLMPMPNGTLATSGGDTLMPMPNGTLATSGGNTLMPMPNGTLVVTGSTVKRPAWPARPNTKYNPRTMQTFPSNYSHDPNTGEKLVAVRSN